MNPVKTHKIRREGHAQLDNLIYIHKTARSHFPHLAGLTRVSVRGCPAFSSH